jgi:hypothetical protein
MRGGGCGVTPFTGFNKVFLKMFLTNSGYALFWGTRNNAEGIVAVEKELPRVKHDKDWL